MLVRDGYVRVDGFLDGAALAAAQRAADEAVRRAPAPGCERPNNRLVPLRWNDELVSVLLEDEDRRRAVARACEGRDLRWISGYLSVKSPREPPLPWHQDWWCWHHPISFRQEAAQVALLVYLTDTDEERGALRVLPASHRQGLPLHAVLAEHVSADTTLDHPSFADQPGQVTLEQRAGDAVLLDYRLLHGTHPNGCDTRRDAVLLSFTPSWATLPHDLRGHLIQHPALPAGDELVSTKRWQADLLPAFAGPRVDLPLNRIAPAAPWAVASP